MEKDQKLWGSWKIDQFIGEGSFGKVYKITREDFGHTYNAALKVLEVPQNQSEYKNVRSEGLSEESAKEYFKSVVEDIVSEFALMSQLKGNSNIVSYEDHMIKDKEDEFGWEIFIRMELLTPLFDYLEKKKLTVRDVIKLGIDICKALEVCQKYNIIHRDIKPENIFVSDTGEFKLGDFGIARQLEKTSGMSKKGTYTYMAPEVYKGQEYNSTVDIYSLGIVLYRFLNNNRSPFMPPITEQIRFSDKEQANIKRLSGEKMPKPANAEGRLAEIVLKACAYNPKERYASPLLMRKELEALIYSDAEKPLAYPNGDTLDNEKNDYISMTEDKDASVEEQFDDSDATFVLKRTEDKRKEQKEMTGDLESEKKKGRITYSKKSLDDQSKPIEEKPVVIPPKTDKKVKQEEPKSVKKKTAKDKTDKKGNGKKIAIILGIVAVIVVGIFACSAINGSKYGKVPSVVGMDFEDAEKAINDAGFEVEKTDKDGVPKDCVVSQQEKSGTKQEKSKPVHIVVNNGLVVVPNLEGRIRREAEILLSRVKLKAKIQEVFSGKIKKGNVVSQSQQPNKKILEGSEVIVKVSKGPEQVVVPKVRGMKASKAKKKLKKLGFKVRTEKSYSSSVKKNRVISTLPKKGKHVNKGSKITIEVSKGKKPASSSSDNSSNYSDYSGSSNSGSSSRKSHKKSSGSSLDDWEVVN